MSNRRTFAPFIAWLSLILIFWFCYFPGYVGIVAFRNKVLAHHGWCSPDDHVNLARIGLLSTRLDLKVALWLANPGGTVDGSGWAGTTQTMAGNVTLGGTKVVTLRLDPSTIFTTSSTSIQPFTIGEGGSIYNLNFNGIAGWNSSVITVTGNIGLPGANQNYSNSHLVNIRCIGADNTAGSACINITVAANFVDWMNVRDVQVVKLAAGLLLKTTTTGWINANYFENYICSLTSVCFNFQSGGTGSGAQIQGNWLPGWQMEFSVTSGLQLLNFTTSGTGSISQNRFVYGAQFDAAAGTIMAFGTGTTRNYVSGNIVLNGSVVYTDAGSNTVCDDFLGACIGATGTLIPIYNGPSISTARQGYINIDSGNRILLQSQANDIRLVGSSGTMWDFTNSQILPGAVNSFGIGSVNLPIANMWIGTAATNAFALVPGATTGSRTINMPDPGTTVNMAFNLRGSVAGSTTLLAANSCGDTVTLTVTGAATTMDAHASGNISTGLIERAWVSGANTVSVQYCNVTTAGITPSAATLQVTVTP